MDIQAGLFLISLVGWWLAFFFYDNRIGGFGWISGLIMIPTFIAALLIFGRDLPPFWVIYAAACGITIIVLRRGQRADQSGEQWTPQAEAIAVGVNFAVIFLGTRAGPGNLHRTISGVSA